MTSSKSKAPTAKPIGVIDPEKFIKKVDLRITRLEKKRGKSKKEELYLRVLKEQRGELSKIANDPETVAMIKQILSAADVAYRVGKAEGKVFPPGLWGKLADAKELLTTSAEAMGVEPLVKVLFTGATAVQQTYEGLEDIYNHFDLMSTKEQIAAIACVTAMFAGIVIFAVGSMNPALVQPLSPLAGAVMALAGAFLARQLVDPIKELEELEDDVEQGAAPKSFLASFTWFKSNKGDVTNPAADSAKESLLDAASRPHSPSLALGTGH